MLIIGIDPGISGALCFLENGKVLDVIEMPSMADGKKNKRQVNGAQIYNEISSRIKNYDKNSVSYFVDDDQKKIGKRINGIEVISFNDLKKISQETNIRNIIIAIPSLNKKSNLRIIKKLIPISAFISSLPPKKYYRDNH